MIKNIVGAILAMAMVTPQYVYLTLIGIGVGIGVVIGVVIS